jgi:hypothetical protein
VEKNSPDLMIMSNLTAVLLIRVLNELDLSKEDIILSQHESLVSLEQLIPLPNMKSM